LAEKHFLPIFYTLTKYSIIKMKRIFLLLLVLHGIFFTKAQIGIPNQTYPENAEDISPLLIGEKIDDITLSDLNNKNIKLKELFSDKPTILVFYRGGWCPYCNHQLSGLQEIESQLKTTGYQLVAISTDKPENLKSSIDKQKLRYELLSDANLELAKSMGIAYKAPQVYHKFLPESTGGMNKDLLLPVPSVFILNKEGEIRFEYIEPNFKERISASLLLAVAETIYDSL